MPKEPPRILAINPGSRYIGIAAFRGPELLDWGVKIVIGNTPRKKLQAGRKIVAVLIEQYCPTVLALKELHHSRSSSQLDELVNHMRDLAGQQGIKVRQYSIQELKDTLCPHLKANKRKLAELLAAMHPALAYDFQREMENQNPYRIRMFEAVALAAVCWHRMENH